MQLSEPITQRKILDFSWYSTKSGTMSLDVLSKRRSIKNCPKFLSIQPYKTQTLSKNRRLSYFSCAIFSFRFFTFSWSFKEIQAFFLELWVLIFFRAPSLVLDFSLMSVIYFLKFWVVYVRSRFYELFKNVQVYILYCFTLGVTLRIVIVILMSLIFFDNNSLTKESKV